MTIDEAWNWYVERYIPIEPDIRLGHGRTVVGSKTNRVCRFCQNGFPAVTFQNLAHALPEFTGNRTLISFEECDQCNKVFSQYDDSLAKYSNLQRTATHVRGKKGRIPSAKSRGGKSRVDVGLSGMEVKQYIDDPIIAIDEETKTLTLRMLRQPYRPIYVYKCFVKMALSLLPSAELVNFGSTIEWLRDSEPSRAFVADDRFFVFGTFFPGEPMFQTPLFGFLKRINDNLPVPYLSFFVGFGSSMYQLCIPCPLKESLIHGGSMTIVQFPMHRGLNLPSRDPISRGTLKFHSTELVTDSVSEIVHGYESSTRARSTI